MFNTIIYFIYKHNNNNKCLLIIVNFHILDKIEKIIFKPIII